jgi:hypothetical protein
MKKENYNTGTILITAYTSSEWDSCDFAIIRITEKWKSTMRKRLAIAIPFENDNSFAHLSYWESPEGFFAKPTEGVALEDFENILNMSDDWAFVTLDDNELALLQRPDNMLDCFQLHLHSDGTACFQAFGKHSNEEFWTASFKVSEIL